jgi:hypothetical protein
MFIKLRKGWKNLKLSKISNLLIGLGKVIIRIENSGAEGAR